MPDKSETPTPSGTTSDKPKKVMNLGNGETIKTLSAQAPVEMHAILESANQALHLDKAAAIRLACRFFIQSCYLGNGQWDASKIGEDNILRAAVTDYSASGLKK